MEGVCACPFRDRSRLLGAVLGTQLLASRDLLYRQSLSIPAPLANELSPTEDVVSPLSLRLEEKETKIWCFSNVLKLVRKL